MMIRNARDKGPQGKQEAGLPKVNKQASPSAPQEIKVPGAAASSRPWTGLRDPRIVRVARTLGGKDRHSKVTTIRGLRDRRVRLSVPTAIQLYDLQDRLGVNQPSKVVDWLLDAARHEIDKLPPLQIPLGCFLQCPPTMAAPNGVSPPPDKEEEPPSGLPMVASMECRAKGRGLAVEEKDGLFRRIEQEQRLAEPHTIPVQGDHLHRQSHASMTGMLAGSEHASCYHMEGPNQLYVPHLGCHPLSQGPEELHGYRSATALPSSMFSAYAAAAAAAAAAASSGYDHKHSNSFQVGSSASQGFMLSYVPSSLHGSTAETNMRPLQLSISSRHHHCHETNNTEKLL